MALKSPLMPGLSPITSVTSTFSPFTDSPNSPAPYGSGFQTASNRSSGPSSSLVPPPSPYPQHMEPSPVDSNGTEGTEIEEDAQDSSEVESPKSETSGRVQSPAVRSATSPSASSHTRQKINTALPSVVRSGSTSDEPQSVILASDAFHDFQGQKSDAGGSEATVVSPTTPEAATVPSDRKLMSVVNTDVPRFTDRATPRAQPRQEAEDDWKRNSRRTSALEDVPEELDKDDDGNDGPSTAGLVGSDALNGAMQQSLTHAEEEVSGLRAALSECWTLCNTLASLSSSHRQRTFKFAGKQDIQEQAWRSCWRMCQHLCDARVEVHFSQVVPTLELCRDFCQSLFDARERGEEHSDSVLRVSFELNNHLYNTHDHSLPEAFNERTLDFYITMCHRLMKLQTSLPQETDALLRACWSLAEMLFNLRQSTRQGNSPDEELLGSAVQACWELCDLFREGWTQIRPERSTPRPSQLKFKNTSQTSFKSSSTRSDTRTESSSSNRQYHEAIALPTMVPETPTTIFDDTTSSAASSPDSIAIPNILVLGPASNGGGSLRGGTHHERWSSNASVLSDYSESTSSQRTSSTATASSEEGHLARLRYLLLRAGMHTGFSRTSGQQLPPYVKALSADAFGTHPWQVKVFELYKKLLLNDKSMGALHRLPSKRVGAREVAISVKWLGTSEQWAWMRDLYRIVLGFGIDEAERKGGGFQV